MTKLPFGFERPEDSPGLLLWQTTVIWQRLINKVLDQYEISHAQFVIMATLLWFEAHNYNTTQILIVNWTKLDKMTVSKSLRKLATLGFVYRVEHARDARAKSVSLTDKGKALVCQLIPIVEQVDAEFFGKVQDNDQQSLVQILNKLMGGEP